MDDARSSLPRREECALHGGRFALPVRVRHFRNPPGYRSPVGLRTDYILDTTTVSRYRGPVGLRTDSLTHIYSYEQLCSPTTTVTLITVG